MHNLVFKTTRAIRALLLCGVTMIAGVAAPGAHAALDAKNAFAYDITVDKTNPLKPVVKYKLSGTPKSVTVCATANGKSVNVVGTANDGENSVTVDLSTIESGEVSFKVITELVEVKTPTAVKVTGSQYTNGYGFYAPWGIAINNAPNSSTFGRIVVTETKKYTEKDSHKNYLSYSANGVGPGIYAFDPKFQPIKNSDGKNGFVAGIASSSTNNIGSSTNEPVHLFERVAFSEDGRLFMTRMGKSTSKLYELDPADLNKEAQVIIAGGTDAVADKHSFIHGLGVSGTGNNLYLSFFSSADYPSSVGLVNNVVKLGTTSTKRTTAPDFTWTTAKNAAGNNVTAYNTSYPQIVWTTDGKGYYFSTYRGTAAEASPGVAYYSVDKTNKTASATNFPGFGGANKGCAIAVSPDGQYLATLKPGSSSGAATIYIYDISAGVPTSETPKYQLSTGLNNTVMSMAFDYASNLYVGSNSSERVYCYVIPNANTQVSVAAPNSTKYTFENSPTATVVDPVGTIVYNGSVSKATWSTSGIVSNGTMTGIALQFKAKDEEEWSNVQSGNGSATAEYSPLNGEFALLVSYTDNSGKAGSQRFAIPASNIYTPPTFTSVKEITGRNSVSLTWDQLLSGSKTTKTYSLKRDGIVIVDKGAVMTTVDEAIPNGAHSYVVVAHFDGFDLESAPYSLEQEIARDPAVTQYSLSVVYNYPIVDAGSSAGSNAVEATGLFQNARFKVGAFGAPGDVYRQGVYHDGKWYLAQLTNSTDNSAGYIPNNTVGVGDTGGVLVFDANDPRKTPVRQHENAPLTNQYIALDADGKLFTRYAESYSGAGIYYRESKYLAMDGTKMANIDFSSTDLVKNHVTTGQIYRIHYISADGSKDKGTMRMFFAANTTPDVQVASIAANGTATLKKYTSPDETGGTENYAFPIEGRKDFIHIVRSHGVYYVNAETGEYTPIFTDNSQIRNAAGHTFAFNNEIFLISATSLNSNNNGHFRIDMAERPLKAGSTTEHEDYTKADFTNLIPVASFNQETNAQFGAGNSNGMWFGTEAVSDKPEDGIYIYQYVPGVRFAKYHFVPTNEYPAVQPEIKVTIKHDDAETEITHFDGTITWKRPENYAWSQTKNFKISHYNVELLDASRNAVHVFDEKTGEWTTSLTVDDIQDADNPVYSVRFGDVNDQRNINWQTYTTRITPVYISVDNKDRVITGETGTAQHQIDYTPVIGDVRANAFSDATHNTYRVDIDFDKGEPEHPVSYYTIQVKAAGSDEYVEIPGLHMLRNGKDYVVETIQKAGVADQDDSTEFDGRIPGTYDFENDKDYSNHGDGDKTIAYYITNSIPTGNTYRVTAHYAAGNQAIYKTAYHEDDVTVMTPTGVESVEGDGTSAVKVYPIPAVDNINVTSGEGILNVRIFSTSGAVVANRQFNGQETGVSMSVSNLTPGVYMLSVNGGTPVRIIKK